MINLKRELHDRIVKDLVDKGLLIQAGWVLFEKTFVSVDTSEAERRRLRLAFFSGAQHLLGSITSMVDPGDEPTDNDQRRMDQIHDELARFAEQLTLMVGPTKGRS